MSKKRMSEEDQLINKSLRGTLTEGQESEPPPKDDAQFTPLEKLIDKANGQGRYQFCSFVIFSTMWFISAWILLGQGFFFEDEFTCYDIEQKQACHNYVCSFPKEKRDEHIKWHSNSIIFAFENRYLICDEDYLKPILTSLVYFGSLVGFFIISFIADNWGRKITTKISWAFFIVGMTAICLADSPNMIGMGQLFAGFGCNPAITLCYSFINEQCLRKSRQYYGIALQVFLALGQCVIGFLFLPQLSWRYITYLILAISVLLFISISYLEESPKFLISRNKKETLEVLNRIAKRNNRKKIEFQEIDKIEIKNSSNEEGASLLDLFRYPSLRWKTISAGFVFLAIQVIYYGTTLNLDKTGYDKLTNQEIVGISEGIGYIGAELIVSKVRRKKTSFIGLVLSSLLCLALAVLSIFQNDDNESTLRLIESGGLILNRFILCGFWAIFYIFIAEMYPTRVRSLGFGWCSAMGTVGSTMAPYLIFGSIQLNIDSWIPPGVIGLLCATSIICLKETYGKPLKDEIQEIEKGI